MSYDSVLLDLNSVKERFDIYNKTFPAEALESLFDFGADSAADEKLDKLSALALNNTCHTGYLFVYKPIFLEIVSRWINNRNKNQCVKVLDACARIIELYPVAVPLVEKFLTDNNDHIITILQNYTTQNKEELRKILLSYYRLLFHNKEVFNKFIRPDILYLLVGSTGEDLLTFLALKVLSFPLQTGEEAQDDIVNAHIQGNHDFFGFYELDSHVNYRFLELNEARRFANFAGLPEVPECFSKISGRQCAIFQPKDLSCNVVSICGTLAPFQTTIALDEGTSFVPTQKALTTLRKLANSIRNAQPIMLCGKAGSGKTFLVNMLSKYAGREETLVKIHLGEQTDAKLLIGAYTSGEKPGSFEWRSGVLTTAVKQGRWVLIEDIDKAPTEVLSVLLTLLEKRELVIPSRGETVKASNGFHLISTVRIDENQVTGNTAGPMLNLIGSRLWNIIHLTDLDDADLHYIVCHRYPILTRLVPRLTHAYRAVRDIYLDPRFSSLNKGAKTRVASVRDLMKLCDRLKSLYKHNGINHPDELIESHVYDNIFAETADCFTGAISEPKALEPLVKSIGESLEISTSRIALYLTKHVPKFENHENHLEIGRALLPKAVSILEKKSANATSFATTNHSLRLMEQISVAVQMVEPVLLVGETGTGKTTVVQQLSRLLNKTLTVINVSQQTETGDLLGGYKPVNSKTIAIPIQENFESLFAATFSLRKNEQFYKMLHKCFNKNQWRNVVRLWKEAFKMAKSILKVEKVDNGDKEKKKKKRKLNEHEQELLLEAWIKFNTAVERFEFQSSSIESSLVFDFVEGSLVKAVRNGEWLLLDEINLASADTLESISDLLGESTTRSILLSDKGDIEPVRAHPNFRIFACMNPATDVGKRDLPPGIRSRFTEIYVHSPDRDITDLLSIIDKYIRNYSTSDEWVGNDVAELYMEAKKLAANNQIVDGSNQRPHFSIRTLTRTLLYVCDIVHIYGLRRALYDGFCMSFLTLLDRESEATLEPIINKYTIGRLKNVKAVLSQAPPSPGPHYIQFRHYWMKKGSYEIKKESHYIITPFVEKNMMNLVRATSSKRFPVLIQGPTSAGKTSMIKYLADITGHKFVRINNHEHTDLQEYLGTYVTDDTGKLSFQEGILVEALRKGYWIVLDELNLAPTDILEALNRLLDDNRELLIPETQEIVHPHPDFMLFATQNPPGIYGGRKNLSRAFRNRFLELHFGDIPQEELEIILRERCQIAPSYAKKIVEVYRQLSIERSASRLFEQKNSFATLRDLFRWAMREAVGYEQLAANGYMLLAERCRTAAEKVVVKTILERVMKVQLNMEAYYTELQNASLMREEHNIVWTGALKRLAVLVQSCLINKEPVLLVGETGCGKTTICQILASHYGKNLISLNAHQNTETSDILGAQRPVRNRSDIQTKLSQILKEVLKLPEEEFQRLSLEELLELYDKMDKVSMDQQSYISQLKSNLSVLFEWCDGPLIHAMKNGDFFLLDEISLAEDSVLERLNSVLEPERSLLLAEKGSANSLIVASPEFQLFATMNPGGDYGKKELSPALRNRFTEIWVSSMEDPEDVRIIVSSKLIPELQNIAGVIVSFSEWFANEFGSGMAGGGIISLRDILAWIDFMNSTYKSIQDQRVLLLHGAAMVFIDALGTNNTAYLSENEERLKNLKEKCITQLSATMQEDLMPFFYAPIEVCIFPSNIKIGPFTLPRDGKREITSDFNWNAPTTSKNLMRVIRAMQVRKPILLEGSPGVGKTSLVTALSELTGNKLTRINLSEHTDLVDLFGSDVPGEKTGEFVWRDAPFLRAMQKGEWVLLDEMNLASQSVLEGLNACLDHRGEAYIPELDRSFTRHPNFVVFAAQNPQHQGGGRKGLPKSFINRFNVVYNDMLTSEDLLLIANKLYPEIDSGVISKIILLMSTLEHEVSKLKKWGASGSPWEFNLRDTLRWLKMLSRQSLREDINVFDFVEVTIVQRFRSSVDQSKARQVVERIFGPHDKREGFYKLEKEYIQVNGEIMKRNPLFSFPTIENMVALQSNTFVYESALRSIKNNWPLILVGPSNSGKTGIINFLASIIGASVATFSMNSEVDSMDILGGYEQMDLSRKISYIVRDLHNVLREIILVNLSAFSRNRKAILASLDLLNLISEQFITISNFQVFCEKFGEVFSFLYDSPQLQILSTRINDMKTLANKTNEVKFEWFDGMLVEAVEKGSWLVLDNANLCSPSVLDRLNSLLENDGVLIINERSEENGEPRVVVPHPNFRLFLTVNPKYGELSRAMRNRGVEIYMEELSERATYFDRLNLGYKKTENILEVENSLDSLSISGVNFSIPLKRYLPSQVSSLQALGQIHDVVAVSTSEPNLEVLLGLMPISQLGELAEWSINVANNRNFMQQKFPTTMCHILDVFGRAGVVQKINDEFYATLEKNISAQLNLDIAIISKQALFPLSTIWSAGLVHLSSPLGACDAASEMVFLFSNLAILNTSFERLQTIASRSMQAKLSDLSYIELSAAIANGRTIKHPPRIPVFELLKELGEQIFQKISQGMLLESYNVHELFWRLLIVWWGIFETAHNKNEAKLRAYKELLEEWLLSAEKHGLDTKSFSNIVSKFNDGVMLRRGTSIALIWEHFKQSYPSSAESWALWDQLLVVSERFDKVVRSQYSESYGSIKSLREIFTALFKDLLQNDIIEFRSLLLKLETGIEGLENISNRFLNRRSNFFKEEFDDILRFVFNEHGKGNEMIIRLAPLSSLTTEKILKQQNERYCHPPVFDLLWIECNDSFHSFTSSLLNSSLFERMIKKSNNLKNFTGSQVRQTLTDAKLLLSATIDASEILLRNQLTYFSNLLKEWILLIVQLHTEENVKGIDNCELTAKVLGGANQSFCKVFKEQLLPALEISSVPISFENLGRGWILFALGLIHIYAPDCPLDPAVHDYVQYDTLWKHKAFSERILKSWISARQVISGDEPLLVEKSISRKANCKDPQIPKVYRPTTSIDGLFDEWTALLKYSLNPTQISGLVDAVENWNEIGRSQLDLFQQNTSRFLQRLKDGYKFYSDLNDIFSGYVLSMKFGFDLMKYDRKGKGKDLEISLLWCVDPLVLMDCVKINHSFSSLSTFLKSSSTDSFFVEKLLSFFLQLFRFHGKSEAMLSTFNDALQMLYFRWSQRRMKDEKLAHEKSSLFKFEDTEDDYEEDFKNMFPDYESNVSTKNEVNSCSPDDLEDSYYLIAKTYMSIFDESAPQSLDEMVSKGSCAVEQLSELNLRYETHNLRATHFSSVINILSNNIESFEKPRKESNINFYRDFSIAESQNAVQIIEALWYFVHQLLGQWPEHATLRELFRICQEFLSYKSSVPIAKQLQKIEQIYTFVTEWEKYASSQVSLEIHIKKITELIISWRKLELQTWSELLAFEEEKLNKNIGKWWFYLFEIIIVSGSSGNGINASQTSLLSHLNIFFSKSTFGEFKARLCLLGAFAKHIELLGWAKSPMFHAIQNALQFYEQFTPLINTHIITAKKSLQKDIGEIILLASWKDVNIDALKQSSRRSHNNLYKLVRKYRYLLSESVQPTIEGGISFSEKVSISNTQLSVSNPPSYNLLWAQHKVIEIPGWGSRPAVLRNTDNVYERMNSWVHVMHNLEFPNLMDLASDFNKEAELLQKETPNVYSKEQKKRLASLKVLKSKLLSDSLKELRRIGLKTSFREDIHKVQSTSTAILSNMVSFTDTALNDCDAYFFRIIDLLPKLRAAVSNPSDDIPIANIEKGMAIAENLIFSLITIRGPMHDIGILDKKYAELLSELESVSISNGEINYSSEELDFQQLKNFCRSFPTLLEYALVTLQAMEPVASKDIELLQSLKLKTEKYGTKMREMKILDSAANDLLVDLNSFVSEVVQLLKSSAKPWNSFIYEVILNWIDEQNSYQEVDVKQEVLDLAAVDETFRTISTSIMLSFQKIMAVEMMSITENDDKWLSKAIKQLMEITKIFSKTSILEKLTTAVRKIKAGYCDEKTSPYVRAVVTFTLPAINHYYRAIKAVMSKTRNYYMDTSRGTYILTILLHNLAKNGFCSPEPPSEMNEEKNLQEGTGLGDGEGAQNNSKDVEEDEDLTENAQEANKDQKDQDDLNEDKNDAVEMEGDMAGDLEELSDQDPNDDISSGEDEDELDEEVDNVDDDDPNAIDDKMWDEKPDTNSKEKDSDKNLDGNNDESDVQAAEKENADDTNQKQGENENDNAKENEEESKQNEPDENISDHEEEEGEEKEEKEEEENVSEQDDSVRQENGDELAIDAPEIETLDLPEDINLDSGDEMSDDDMNIDGSENSDGEEDKEEEGKQEETTAMSDRSDVSESDLAEEEEDEEMDDIADESTESKKLDEPLDGSEEERKDEVSDENISDEDNLANDQINQNANQLENDEQQAEGLDGLDEDQENADIDPNAAAQQQFGSKGTGSDSKDSEEQENLGNTGNSQKYEEYEHETHEPDINDSTREEAREALKQLGDSMKEYHKRRKEINEASEQHEQEQEPVVNANERPDEFEHVNGANTETDTQALGMANQEQSHSVDLDKAIEDDFEQYDQDEDGKTFDENEDQVKPNGQPEEVNGTEEQVTGEKAEPSVGGISKGLDGVITTDETILETQTNDELELLMDDIDEEIHQEEQFADPPRDLEESRALWHKSELATSDLSARLSEQLRLILEPTLATKLQGDYKTGKRLNMKRIIPYIASQFRKDKIWLRRTKPSKRQYQIMIALDDSKSMSESKCVKLAFESLCLVSKTLTQLESGGLSIVKFGDSVKEVHPFGEQFSSEAGARSFQWFGFQETKTDIRRLVAESIKIFERSKAYANGDQWQLQIIISDGVCEDHETVQRLVRRARENKIMIVFVIIDGINANESIIDMSQVKYVPDQNGNMQLKIDKYLDTFPFEFYVVVHDISELPQMLSIILKQYFTDLASAE
ncbi:related to Midasin [Zygosaccharomyces bailii]|nr:related to Midasin [Zygosaccharomyces bailii]